MVQIGVFMFLVYLMVQIGVIFSCLFENRTAIIKINIKTANKRENMFPVY